MLVSALTIAFADVGWNAVRTIGNLVVQAPVAAKTRPVEDGSNCIGRFDRAHINLQLFKGFGHISRRKGIFRAASRVH